MCTDSRKMQKTKSKMKNERCKQVFVSAHLSVVCTILILLVFGCEESLQASKKRPERVPVDQLGPEAMRIIQDCLADDDPQARARAVEVIIDTKRVEMMPKVQRLLEDKVVPVRFLALLAVGELEYRFAGQEVAQLLKDKDQNVRIAAAYAAFKLGSPEKLEILGKAITSKDQSVRANAVVLLGKTGNTSALQMLYWAMRDEGSDYKVRFQAAEAIARLGDQRIYRTLWTMLISAFADDRVMGVRAMGALGTAQAKDVLITMLDDDILEVRLVAAEQLGMLGDTSGEANVLQFFAERPPPDTEEEGRERVNVLAALAIGRIGTKPLQQFLPQLLKDESKFVRLAAAKAVLQCVERENSSGRRLSRSPDKK